MKVHINGKFTMGKLKSSICRKKRIFVKLIPMCTIYYMKIMVCEVVIADVYDISRDSNSM
jgi:hypothetical protein